MDMWDLEELLNEQHRKIDKLAEADKKGITYLVDLIRHNCNKFNRVFNPDNSIPEEELAERIYSSVEGLIDVLTSLYTEPAGVAIYRFKEGQPQKFAAVQLGWARFKKMFPDTEYKPEEEIPHNLVLTDLGQKVINGYRSARGEIELDKLRKENERNFFQ